uniref:Endoplasmic reticulum transmembrane protein n=1 Tax=Globodera pallida TaxID=36090 RepID=A0A183CBT7_GLOPA
MEFGQYVTPMTMTFERCLSPSIKNSITVDVAEKGAGFGRDLRQLFAHPDIVVTVVQVALLVLRLIGSPSQTVVGATMQAGAGPLAARQQRACGDGASSGARRRARQLVAVINTLITVGGSFAFGFFGVEFAYPQLRLDVATRMLLGLVLATLVFFADLYFLVKGMETEEQSDRKNIDK